MTQELGSLAHLPTLTQTNDYDLCLLASSHLCDSQSVKITGYLNNATPQPPQGYSFTPDDDIVPNPIFIKHLEFDGRQLSTSYEDKIPFGSHVEVIGRVTVTDKHHCTQSDYAQQYPQHCKSNTFRIIVSPDSIISLDNNSSNQIYPIHSIVAQGTKHCQELSWELNRINQEGSVIIFAPSRYQQPKMTKPQIMKVFSKNGTQFSKQTYLTKTHHPSDLEYVSATPQKLSFIISTQQEFHFSFDLSEKEFTHPQYHQEPKSSPKHLTRPRLFVSLSIKSLQICLPRQYLLLLPQNLIGWQRTLYGQQTNSRELPDHDFLQSLKHNRCQR